MQFTRNRMVIVTNNAKCSATRIQDRTQYLSWEVIPVMPLGEYSNVYVVVVVVFEMLVRCQSSD